MSNNLLHIHLNQKQSTHVKKKIKNKKNIFLKKGMS